MTLPSNQILPFVTDFKNFHDLNIFIRALLYALEERDDHVVEAVNGTIRSNVFVGREQWTPVLKGTTTPGTFTYTQQVGWVLRQGLIVDVWGDIIWTANAGSVGNLYVELPYLVALSLGKPFVGVVQSSTFAYTGGTGIVINAIPNTYRGEFWDTGSGFVTANQGIPAAGQLIFHVRYIGVQNE